MRRACPGLLCLFVVVACDGGAGKPRVQQGPAPDETTTVDLHHCTVSLVRKEVPSYTGRGSDADPAKAREAAWTDVCARLPETTRVHCRNDARFTVAETADAGKIHSVGLTLTPVVAKLEGKAEHEPDRDTACRAAILEACEAAGVKHDCVASGAYVKAGEVAGTTPTVLSPPQ